MASPTPRAWRQVRAPLAALLAFLTLGAMACAGPNATRHDESVRAGSSKVVTYVDAVVYAGATHYYFSDDDGREIRVIESRDPGAPTIRNIERLLDPDPVEGPPGPDPDLLDRPVILRYDDRGRVIGVAPLPR